MTCKLVYKSLTEKSLHFTIARCVFVGQKPSRSLQLTNLIGLRSRPISTPRQKANLAFIPFPTLFLAGQLARTGLDFLSYPPLKESGLGTISPNPDSLSGGYDRKSRGRRTRKTPGWLQAINPGVNDSRRGSAYPHGCVPTEPLTFSTIFWRILANVFIVLFTKL